METFPLYRSRRLLRYFTPAKTFCLASSGSSAPYSLAITGISCMSPLAPTGETASGLKRDSAWMTALTRAELTP